MIKKEIKLWNLKLEKTLNSWSYLLLYESLTPRVGLHTPKLLITQFHTIKIIIIQFHTSSHAIFIHFRKAMEKKLNHFCDFLRTVEQSGNKKTALKFFWKNCLPYNFHIRHKNFSVVILKTCPNIFFVFFSTANLLLYANKHFPKNACNVVLDTIILASFLFT